MFTNLGQIANSFTAYCGLEVSNMSTTHSLQYLREELNDFGSNDSRVKPAMANNVVAKKDRVVGSLPRPPFVMKLPELNLELGLIAVSLAIQQVSRITSALRLISSK
jgi:hypothetical protein